jgi:hypothetical protein
MSVLRDRLEAIGLGQNDEIDPNLTSTAFIDMLMLSLFV